MTLNVTSLTPGDCLALLIRLNRYGNTNIRLLHTLLMVLSVGTAINFSLSVMSCFLPARHVSRTTLFMLIVGPIAILVPYFVFDARLDRLSLRSVRLPSSVQVKPPDNDTSRSYKGQGVLFKSMDHCEPVLKNWPDVPGRYKNKTTFPPKRDTESKYYFGKTEDRWEVAIIVCTLGSAVVGLRALFGGLRDRTDVTDEEMAQAATERGLALHAHALHRFELGGPNESLRDAQLVERVLERLRVDDSEVGAVREKQCVICLDDMREGVVTRLLCEHVYHQECIREWLQTAYRRECPTCKAAIGEGGRGEARGTGTEERTEEEEDGGTRNEEAEGAEGTDEATAGTEGSDATAGREGMTGTDGEQTRNAGTGQG